MCLTWLVLKKVFQYLVNEGIGDDMVVIEDEDGRLFKTSKRVDDFIQNVLEGRELRLAQ